jgi:hypothetical protein
MARTQVASADFWYGGGDLGPLSSQALGVLTGLVFVGGEALLDVSFAAARIGLVSVIRGGALLTASQDAYGEGVVGLARVGPVDSVPGLSRLVEVKFREPVTHGDSVVVALRWEAVGPGSGLFPALDADITLARAGENATSLRLDGAYRPPLGVLGAGLDRAILHQVATATIRGFLDRLGETIAHPAAMTGPAQGDGRLGPSRLPPDAEVS